MSVREIAKANAAARVVAARLRARQFVGSATYWEHRYEAGGDSGAGSHGRLRRYKAEYLNTFVQRHAIDSVVEFGSGDGDQLELAEYPSYLGIDVSRTAVQRCIDRFAADHTKAFVCCDPSAVSEGVGLFAADLALSLDVIYHLVEDDVFDAYMRQLFAAGRRFVVVYSSNHDGVGAAHVRHRHFTRWAYEHAAEWTLTIAEDPPFPFDPSVPDDTSWASFFVFARRTGRDELIERLRIGES